MRKPTQSDTDTTIEVHEGSGNVWEDLGHPEPEWMAVKSELVICIDETLHARRLTQAQAAELMGLEPSQLANLLRGRFSAFSVHRLLEFLTALGRDVNIVVGPPKSAPRRGRVRVRVS